MFIATGYGTEAYLTDIRCNQIIDQILTPAFQQNDFYGGIDNATTEMMKYMTGAYEGQPYGNANDAPPTLIIIIIIIIIIFLYPAEQKVAEEPHLAEEDQLIGVAEASAVLEEVVLAAAEAVEASADLVVAVLVAVELAVLGDAPMLLCFLLHSLNYTCISHA